MENQSTDPTTETDGSPRPALEQGASTSENIDVEFTVRLVIKDAIDRQALRSDYHGDLLGYIRYLTTEEGLLGCTQDDYEIIEAHEVPPPVPKRHSFVKGTCNVNVCGRCDETRDDGNHYTKEDVEKILKRRRAMMPDYDKRLKEWLS